MGILAPSGAGKTTLFRLLMGLEAADRGVVETYGAVISAVFQEDRLCEKLNAADNVRIVNGSTVKDGKILKDLTTLLPEESLQLPICALSGGMKRRAALVRAMTSPGDLVLLDEPFTGLDEENREAAIRYIDRQLGDRILIIASHEPSDFQKLKVHSLLVREENGNWEQLEV
ncbi:MAG: ATP-binding cassette domain-containing protein [Fusicatenibacter sp.]|nr:ATP-binding cassette domain-containing protein [Fusicatenibacter sp.]